MVIRDATGNDANRIASIHAESWRSAYHGIFSDDYLQNHAHRDRLALWQERFSANSRQPMLVLVAEAPAGLAGFACVFPDRDPVFGSFLDNLHVASELTGQGIGRHLLSEISRRLQGYGSRSGIYLWVLEQNPRARKFYERAGGVVVGSEARPMPDGQSILSFRCYWPDPKVLLL